MFKTNLFRKVSLDRLSSPEQLDQLMQVTDARGWIALAAVGLVLGTAAVWSVAGTVPENVHGTGILIKSGGVFEVVPAASGRVADIGVGVGDTVSEGQIVARLEQPELRERLQQTKATLENRRADLARVLAFGAADAGLQARALTQQRRTLEETLAGHERQATWLAEKVANQQTLVREGLVTRTTLAGTQQQLDQARERVNQARSELAQSKVRELDLQNRRRAEAEASRIAVLEQERTIAELERELVAKSEVRAPYSGRILEIMAERGNVVGAGEPVLSLDLSGRMVKELEAVVYVPSTQGKQVREGMTIQIAPSTVKQEEYGLMLGRVTYVSDFPATSKGMRRVLKNERLVSQLSGEDAPYEVHADLEVDPATVSRYRWSSSKGPPMRIQSGTLAGASIVVRTKRPVELVIPLLRKYVGV